MTAARATGLAVLALLAAAVPAEAGPAGWTRVTPAAANVPATLDAGVARDPDRALHVLWTAAGAPASVFDSALSADARRVRGPRRVAAYGGAVNASLALAAVPGGMRAVFAGLHEGGALDRVVASAFSSGRGAWDAAQPVTSPEPGHAPYAAAGIAAAGGKGGTLASAWGSPGAGFQLGLDPGVPQGSFSSGDATDPGVGIDAAGGQIVVAWNRFEGGLAALQVSPPGERHTPPGRVAPQPGHRVGVTGRIGAPGVYVSYPAGVNEFSARPALWRFGASRGRLVSRSAGARDVGLAAAPGGRLWLFWQRDGRLQATRSDPSATRFGARASVAAPRGTRLVHDLAGEGSRGPLDLLALLTRRRHDTGIWHRRLLPRLALSVPGGSGRRITLLVTDAGVRVPGASVRIAGAGQRRSGLDGSVRFRLPPGTYRALARKGGFSPAVLRLRVR